MRTKPIIRDDDYTIVFPAVANPETAGAQRFPPPSGRLTGGKPGGKGSDMRVVVQRVREAAVRIDGVIRGEIGLGLLVLLGVEEDDTQEDVDWLTGKIARMRIFADAEGRINLACTEVGGSALVVSQFTLFASTKKGNRPSFSQAARPEIAVPLYEALIAALSRELDKPVATGEFGADMQVSLINDGPVTIWMDSKWRE